MLLIKKDRSFQVVARPVKPVESAFNGCSSACVLRPKHPIWSSIKRFDQWSEEWADELDEIETTLVNLLYEVPLDRHFHLLMKRADFCNDLRKLAYRLSSNSRRKRE